jgi:hypothetical protein
MKLWHSITVISIVSIILIFEESMRFRHDPIPGVIYKGVEFYAAQMGYVFDRLKEAAVIGAELLLGGLLYGLKDFSFWFFVGPPLAIICGLMLPFIEKSEREGCEKAACIGVSGTIIMCLFEEGRQCVFAFLIGVAILVICLVVFFITGILTLPICIASEIALGEHGMIFVKRCVEIYYP